MIIEIDIESKCPYCGEINIHLSYIRQLNKNYQSIVMCDVNEGGCDKPYTAEYYVKITVEKSKKILGYE